VQIVVNFEKIVKSSKSRATKHYPEMLKKATELKPYWLSWARFA
jgi:hypothetical protein